MTYKIEYDDETSSDINAPQPTSTLKINRSDKRAEQAKVWEATVSKTEDNDAPITKKDVSGKDPDAPSDVLPDRALVAPSLREFLKAKAPVITNPIVEQADRLEQALTAIQTPAPEPMSFEDTILSKIEGLEQGMQERAQKEADDKAKAEYDNEINTFRTRIVKSIQDRKEDFPALIALGREEAVVNELLAAAERDEELSEVDVASEIEKGLWTMYENMSPLSDTKSKDKTKPSAKQTTTSPTKDDIPDPPVKVDDFALHTAQGKKAAQEALWNNIIQNREANLG
jgi:hypothetical protein